MTPEIPTPDERDELSAVYGGIGFHARDAWKTAEAVYDEHTLRILGHPVMEDWERPYMRVLAGIAARGGGRVLEIGFGMGISAGFIAATPGVTEHLIIEANHDVAERARRFAATVDGVDCRVHEGLWEEVIDRVPDGSVDGILYDAYPLEESEVMNQARFAPVAYRKLRPGGTFTYFSDEARDYRPEHLAMLLAAGFVRERIDSEIVAVDPPEDCQYWKSSTLLAPILVR
ncbi:hypothetical protein GCM10009682_54090 [Luedemannella flava]|uniref:Guanidinoacetate N-methyltransferase n=1 Tax=Luedemannella flava TaxID=349316 RepID=A0ABP4YWU5_9ACTN